MANYSKASVIILGVKLMHKYKVANVLRYIIDELFTIDSGNTSIRSRVPHISTNNSFPFLHSCQPHKDNSACRSLVISQQQFINTVSSLNASQSHGNISYHRFSLCHVHLQFLISSAIVDRDSCSILIT